MSKLKYKAFVVLGGESTGTRMMTKFLIQAGCYGDSGHKQKFDLGIEGADFPLVWRRSFPHEKRWINLGTEIINPLLQYASLDEIFVLVMSRNWFCTIKSAVGQCHVHNVGQAKANLEHAYSYIFRELFRFILLRYQIVSYDMLTSIFGYRYLLHLFKELGLNTSYEFVAETMKIFDGNKKHFDRMFTEEY